MNAVQAARHGIMSHLDRIQNALREHALGQREMTASQVKAAQVLMNKVMPDLKAIEHTGELQHQVMGGFIFKVRDADASDSRD